MNPPHHQSQIEDPEEPLSMDNSGDEGPQRAAAVPQQNAQQQHRLHQAMLRQQASAPVGLPSRSTLYVSNLSHAISNPNRYSNPRLDETVNNTVERPSRHVPEHHSANGLNTVSDDADLQISTPASWSVVETYGGTPPSAKSRKYMEGSSIIDDDALTPHSPIFLAHQKFTPRQS
jgi:hypothetical protein